MKEAINQYWHPALRNLEGGNFSDGSWLDDPMLVRQMAKAIQLAKGSNLQPTLGASDADATWQRLVNVTVTWPAVRAEEMRRHENLTTLDETETAAYIVQIFEDVAESFLLEPTFIQDFPKSISPLSKASPDNSAIAERFELYVAGMEVANGFSELNDPAEQLERFEDQARQRERGDEEAMQMDLDYVRALSYGMPPAAGIGIGIDRLTMLLTNRRSIRDVILFPHMRPRQASEEAGGSDEGGAAPA
jgi:lysyl-tRNA synthetase class 2